MKPTLAAIIIVICLSVVGSAFSQSYSIPWYKIAGGGGTSTNGQYSISGTIGQADASTLMNAGNYSLTGGFWSIYAVQTAGAPLLTITVSNSLAIVSWPLAATGWTLQTNNNLATGTWGNYSGAVVNNRITNPSTATNLFFRLKQ